MAVSETLANYLISTIEGSRFEILVQRLLGIRDGDQFVALGGTHDGGADGFERSVLEDRAKPTSFVQISVQDDAGGKIRQTVKRLRAFGRDVRSITYWTTKKLLVDVLEERLSDDLDVTIRIRDRDALLRLINSSPATISAFNDYFQREIYELTSAQNQSSEPEFDVVTDPSVYVYLQFEQTQKLSKGGLVGPIVDSLIYWALRDTDPEVPRLIERDALKRRIAELLPAAATILVPNIDGRLWVLSTKDGGGEQRVRRYRQTDSYCLPHAIRVELATESAKEIELKALVIAFFADRASQHGATEPKDVAEVCARALYRHFHEQGLLLSAFLDKRLEGIAISDQIVESELQKTVAAGTKLSGKSYAAALKVLQGVLYTPNDAENEYLHRLSKTTMLLFTLKHCPRLVEYFNQMSGKFRLFIGTDILVKAISETFLPEEHRHVTNLLKVARACGASLVLADVGGGEKPRHFGGEKARVDMAVSATVPHFQPRDSVSPLRQVKGLLRRAIARP